MISNKIRVAIIGSGPAGFYAAEHLQKQLGDKVFIDMFDKLPTPYGLVRSGVAPDHQKIKTVTRIYDKIAANPNFRFFGLVEFGNHINIEDIKKHYHQIVFATGAQSDRKMNIKGEHLKGSHTATEFVAWYNGHPYFKHLDFDLSGKKVVIIGMGNVAVDVARILCKTDEELQATDIADYALEKLKQSNINEVIMVGRRGPAQAAFTNPELKELRTLSDSDLITLPEEVALDPLTIKSLEERPDRSTKLKVEILKEASKTKPTKNKTLTIRFLMSPVEIIGDGKIKAIKLVKNRPILSKDGSIRAQATDEYEILDTDIVFRSIGYMGMPLSDIPFNDNGGTIMNDMGRIVDPSDKTQLAGLYATGWIKRGPTGVIGTNKTDSNETVKSMIEDIEKGIHIKPENDDPELIPKLIKERQPNYISYEDWLIIDEYERKKGEEMGKPRIKFTDTEEILKYLKKV